MKVFFLVPPVTNRPTGGLKIIYEYANRLTDRGYDVCIGYNMTDWARRLWIPNFIRKIIAFFYGKYGSVNYPSWFTINSSVKRMPIFAEKEIPNADAIVATAYTTVDFVWNNSTRNKLYLIQDFECWGVSEETVIQTYKLGMKNIVISNWLYNIVSKYVDRDNVKLIPNGIDLSCWGINKPISERKHSVCMLYHEAEFKGSKFGIEAIIELRKIYSDLKVTLFGAPSRPKNLPTWINYKRNANQQELKEIYNNAAVYLYPSINEGFGLTCVEAMACGCALCTTNYDGAKDFVNPNVNALISNVRDVNGMVKNVVKLFESNIIRVKIAKNGLKDVQKFNWNNSVDMFESILRQ